MRTLWNFLREFGTLTRGDRPHGDGALQRLIRWLEPFQRCFGHRAHTSRLRHVCDGLLSDSERKSMQAMLARVTEPITYQAFQHFITHAAWDAERIWRRLREVLPERTGILIIDGTSFPKQGPHSVGVARQYCGALGKVANCQVAVTAALWTGAAGVADRRAAVSAGGVDARSGRPRRRADPRDGPVPGEMAPGADVDPPRARSGVS